MCGFVGFAGKGDQAILMSMAQTIVHRGPDAEGYVCDAVEGIYLGHRRLAILDAAGGHQPMSNASGDVHLVYNGEIYNHVELRAELVAAGYVFVTDHSDTEVLLHGWKEWGEDLPTKLNGMFAFVIYDVHRRILFLARDRFGEKPLYYSDQNGTFIFASELNALLQHPLVERKIDRLGIKKLFAYGYIPAPNTHLLGCRKVPAGHALLFDLHARSMRMLPYWNFALTPDESLTDQDEARLIEELRHLLSQAVQRRLISDVPLGVFLSGGLDSSTITALVALHHDPAEIETFSIGFTEASYDESRFAREVANWVGTTHREKVLDLAQAKHLIPKVLARLDEPQGDPSILPTYLLCAFAREHVTVALSGDGGDELFAGYDPFAALGSAKVYRSLVPSSLHKGIRRLADLLPRSSKNMSFDYRLRRLLTGLSYSEQIQAPVWMAPLEPEEISELINEPIDVEELYSEAIAVWNDGSSTASIDRMLEFYSRLYLQDNILPKVDRAAMMVSLESRAVFLDNDLVEFCQRLPNRFKYRDGTRKYLLKKAVRPFLPASIVDRRKKGFGIPVSDWLKDVPPTPPMMALGGLDLNAAQRYWEEHRSGLRDHRLFLWSWLALQYNCIENFDLR